VYLKYQHLLSRGSKSQAALSSD